VIEAVVGVALRAILASVVLGAVLSGLVLVVTRRSALTAATRHALWTTAMIATALIAAGRNRRFADPCDARRDRRRDAVVRAGWAAPRSIRRRHGSVQSWTRTPAGIPAIGARTTTSGTVRAATAPSAWCSRSPDGRRASPRARSRVVGVWGLGALIGMIGLAASVWRIRGLKRRSSPLDGALADELPWLTATGSGREIYLRLSYEIETPVAVGFAAR